MIDYLIDRGSDCVQHMDDIGNALKLRRCQNEQLAAPVPLMHASIHVPQLGFDDLSLTGIHCWSPTFLLLLLLFFP